MTTDFGIFSDIAFSLCLQAAIDGPDSQAKCEGCRMIEALMGYWFTVKRRHPTATSIRRPIVVHESFHALDSSSRRCITCRLVRRAILLDQPTFDMVERLTSSSDLSSPRILATLQQKGESTSQLQLAINLVWTLSSGLRQNRRAAVIALAGQSKLLGETSILERADDKCVYNQIRQWAQLCLSSHSSCGNLAWSSRPPTRLLFVGMGDGLVQLVKPDGPVAYIALSYCWGKQPDAKRAEAVENGKTKVSNLERRCRNPFSVTELPHTIQDAVQVAKGVGVDHIWIDTVCIVQDNAADWDREAALMHQVYANAHFTLCTTAVDDATARIFQTREASKYKSETCRLNGNRLSIASRPFRDIIDRSPWSTRAWTLQEEILSPRLLYWTPHNTYWSCAEMHKTELGTSPTLKPHPVASDEEPQQYYHGSSQEFLKATRSGIGLHEKWLDLVEEYSRRDLTFHTDKHKAISGLAARYQERQPHDIYLAGLWQSNLAQEISWKVEQAVAANDKNRKMGIDAEGFLSWTWAALPARAAIRMKRDKPKGRTLRIVETQGPGTQDDVTPPKLETAQKVERGTRLQALVVRGRLRPLCNMGSLPVPWDAVVFPKPENQQPGQSEKLRFTFQLVAGLDVHSVDLQGGLLIAYNPHAKETVAQIDHLVDAEDIIRDPSGLECLEVSRDTMLLVRRQTGEGDGENGKAKAYLPTFERVGVSWQFRHDFFSLTEERVVRLV